LFRLQLIVDCINYLATHGGVVVTDKYGRICNQTAVLKLV